MLKETRVKTMKTALSCAITAVLVGASLASPDPAEAQRRRGEGGDAQATTTWSPVSVGLRIGDDQELTATVLGAQVRLPVLRNGRFEIVPSGDVMFLTGLRAYQFNLDGVVVIGGRGSGVYAGGGYAARNSIFAPTADAERETKHGTNIVAGLKTGPLGGARVGVQVEFRWTFVDEVVKPRILSVGVNFSLWRAGRSAP